MFGRLAKKVDRLLYRHRIERDMSLCFRQQEVSADAMRNINSVLERLLFLKHDLSPRIRTYELQIAGATEAGDLAAVGQFELAKKGAVQTLKMVEERIIVLKEMFAHYSQLAERFHLQHSMLKLELISAHFIS